MGQLSHREDVPFPIFDADNNLCYLDTLMRTHRISDTRPSGGEKALIGLALRLALAEQAQMLTPNGKLRILVLDEVLSALDDDRREGVQRLFADVLRQGLFDHILLITHLAAVKQEWPSHWLEVERTADGSRFHLGELAVSFDGATDLEA